MVLAKDTKNKMKIAFLYGSIKQIGKNARIRSQDGFTRILLYLPGAQHLQLLQSTTSKMTILICIKNNVN